MQTLWRKDESLTTTSSVAIDGELEVALRSEIFAWLESGEGRATLASRKRSTAASAYSSAFPFDDDDDDMEHSPRIESVSGQLIHLLAELTDCDATEAQIRVAEFLREQLEASEAFCLFTLEDDEELCCQVLGGRRLDELLRFSIGRQDLPTDVDASQSRHQPVLVSMDALSADIAPAISDALRTQAGGGREDDFRDGVRSSLCMPMMSSKYYSTRGLFCVVNKRSERRFSVDDSRVLHLIVKACSGALLSKVTQEQRARVTDALMRVAKILFTHLDDVNELVENILSEAKLLTHAERCSLFLLDEERQELVAKVFDGHQQSSSGASGHRPVGARPSGHEVRIPTSQGIAGIVATSGKMLNIGDAYSHPQFYRQVDQSTGFKTRNILCFPIKVDRTLDVSSMTLGAPIQGGQLVGVAQLCNKISGSRFTKFDEELTQAFSMFCGISIIHALLYEKLCVAQHRSRLSNELMTHYQLKITDSDYQAIVQGSITRARDIAPDFQTFDYLPRQLIESRIPEACMSLFDDLELIDRFRINRATLARFLCLVCRGYRDVPYHNVRHAFSVMHFGYLLAKHLRLSEFIDDLAVFALMVSCLCHDLDHRGTTNSFQVASDSVLASLYSSEGSVMERHHLAQTMCIINSEGSNIFEALSSADYQRALDYIRDMILATDLAHHLKAQDEMRRIITKDGYNRDNERHHYLITCMLMTACDLSDQSKPWSCSKEIARLVYKEFFSQGDLEKAMGHSPSEMMDRERACIPQLQIQFIGDIVVPVFELTDELLGPLPPESLARPTSTRANRETRTLATAVRRNVNCWKLVQNRYNSGRFRLSIHESSIDIFQDGELFDVSPQPSPVAPPPAADASATTAPQPSCTNGGDPTKRPAADARASASSSCVNPAATFEPTSSKIGAVGSHDDGAEDDNDADDEEEEQRQGQRKRLHS